MNCEHDLRRLYFGGEQGSAGFTGHQHRGVLWSDDADQPVVFVTIRYRGHLRPKVTGAIQAWDDLITIDGDLNRWRLTHHQSGRASDILFPPWWKRWGQCVFEVRLDDGNVARVIRRSTTDEGTTGEILQNDRAAACVLRLAHKRRPAVALRDEWKGQPKITLKLPQPLDVETNFGPRSLAVVTDRVYVLKDDLPCRPESAIHLFVAIAALRWHGYDDTPSDGAS